MILIADASWLRLEAGVVLSLFYAFIVIVVFLIGDKAEIAVVERLIYWYDEIVDGKFSDIIPSSARALDSLLNRALGPSIFSIRALLTWTIPLSLITFLIETTGETQAMVQEPLYTSLFVMIAIIDFLPLCLGRLLLRRIARSRHTFFWLALYMLLSYFTFGLAGFNTMKGPTDLGQIFLWPTRLASLFTFYPSHAYLGIAFYLLLSCSTTLLVAVMFAAFVVYLLEPATKPLILRFLNRLVDEKRLLRTLSGAGAIVVGLLLALIGIIPQ